MTPTEKFVSKNFFIELGGFSPLEFTKFLKSNGIMASEMGYPVFEVMRCLRNSKNTVIEETELDRETKKAKLEQIKIINAIKSKKYINRQLAIDRMRTTLQGIAGKVKYGAKLAAPRCPGVMNVRDIENIILEGWESAIDSLLEECKNISNWEDYAIDNIQLTGTGMAQSTETSLSTGDSEEDSLLDQIEYP